MAAALQAWNCERFAACLADNTHPIPSSVLRRAVLLSLQINAQAGHHLRLCLEL